VQVLQGQFNRKWYDTASALFAVKTQSECYDVYLTAKYLTISSRCKYQLLRRLSVQALTFISAISDDGRATTTTLYTNIHTTFHLLQ